MLEFKEASEEEKSEAFRQVFSVWPHADNPDEHLRRRLSSVQHARASWFVGLLEGKVVTSLGAYPYQLYGPDGHRSARFFGAVYTDVAARGRGYAERLLKWVMHEYGNRGVQDFCLFSDIGLHYYEKLGFRALPSYEWEFEVPDTAPQLDGPLQVLPLGPVRGALTEAPFGILRSPQDDEWVFRKQMRPLSLAGWGESYWLFSMKEGGSYMLLESNLPQGASDWDFFRSLVQADARRLGCDKARGWWTGAGSSPDPAQHEILPRDKEVLMWHSLRGPIDAWYEPIVKHGFRSFASEHI